MSRDFCSLRHIEDKSSPTGWVSQVGFILSKENNRSGVIRMVFEDFDGPIGLGTCHLADQDDGDVLLMSESLGPIAKINRVRAFKSMRQCAESGKKMTGEIVCEFAGVDDERRPQRMRVFVRWPHEP